MRERGWIGVRRPPPADEDAIVDDDGGVPVVLWDPIRCPCGSREHRCYGHARGDEEVRYHVCHACYRRFKSKPRPFNGAESRPR